MPIKSRKKEELLKAYKEMYAYCEQKGFKPQLHKLENETSKDVEASIASQNTSMQYSPPDMYRTNEGIGNVLESSLNTLVGIGRS